MANVVKIDVSVTQEVVKYDHSATKGFVGELTHSFTTIRAISDEEQELGREKFMGVHPMTRDNYTKKLRERMWRKGHSWLGETKAQHNASLDAKFDAAYRAGGKVLRDFKNAELARTAQESAGEMRRVALGLSLAGHVKFVSN